MNKVESRLSKVKFHMISKIEVTSTARAKLNSHEVKSKTPENVRVSQLPNFPILVTSLKIIKIYMSENTEGTHCDISGTGENPSPISSSPEKEGYLFLRKRTTT